MPARLDSLHGILAFISEHAREKGFQKEALNRMQLVAEEALVNVFHYAYPPRQEGDVEVRLLEKDGPVVEIEIRDKGIPFDPLSAGQPDVNADIPERKIGGMGIFFVRKMADEVRYRRDEDTNILGLTFFNR